MKYLIILIAVFVSGCKTNGHKEFYQGYDLDELPLEMKQNMEFLSPTEEPAIYRSNNIQRDFEDLLSKRYIRIGHSRFNGGYEPIENIIKQAKSVGAVVVLTTSNYTNTETSNYTLYMPTTKTSTHNGNINSTVTSPGSLSTAYVNSQYSGTTTTSGSKAYSGTQNTRRYDQSSIYFAKSIQKVKFGIRNSNLNTAQRKALKRNTGSLVVNVWEKSPAFYANILINDLIISVDGKEVLDGDQAVKMMNNIPAEQKSSTLTIIRDGVEKNIVITFQE
jgi:hypothetical protein